MTPGALGKVYRDGETIVRQGEMGDSMFVIQQGNVEVLREEAGETFRLTSLGPGELFGEMSLCEKAPRSATVRAVGEARVLTVDRRTFLGRVQEDPSLAFRVLQTMSARIRLLDQEIARLRERLGAAQMEP
jgi:CRP/FNR family cyclic AMP-dependent transcriptional regulator